MTLKDRRRALMGAQSVSSLTFEDIPVGSPFMFRAESTVIFVYLGIAYGNAILLRELAISSAKKIESSITYPVTYVDSLVDTYCSTTFYDTFDAKGQSIMADSSIDCIEYDGSVSSTATIARKIFCLSVTDIETTFIGALKAYYSTTNANTARIAKKSDDTTVRYWLRDARTAGTGGYVRVVETTGVLNYTGENAGSIYVRPAVSVAKTTPLVLVNGVYLPK